MYGFSKIHTNLASQKYYEMAKVTTRILLDTRLKNKTGSYPVRLRVTHVKTQKYFSIGMSMTPEEWEKTIDPKAKKKFKENKLYLETIENRANEVIKKIHPFSFEVFKREFDGTSPQRQEVFAAFQQYVNKLRKEERIRTADSYSSALISIKKFIETKKQKRLVFEDITVDWLNAYEDWMLENNKSISTIGIYIRSLRTIIGIAINDKVMKPEQYPFGRNRYKIPASENVKKALPSNDLKKLFEYVPQNKAEEKALDMWKFTYLCNGINFKDIAKLRFMDISETNIQFFRSKIVRSGKENMRPIVVPLEPELKAIIDKWSVEPESQKSYVFGIINSKDSPAEQAKKIQQATKINNKYTKRIGESLGLPIKLTTYTARHSFATMLKRKNAPVAFISESLGHKDIKTTQSYLDSFEDDTKRAFQRKLLDFD